MLLALIIVGSLAALIGLAILIGSLLPVKHKAIVERRLPAPRQLVWEVISDFGGTAEWVKGVAKVEHIRDADGGELYREYDSKGGGISYRTEPMREPYSVTRRIADKGLPFGGSWTIQVEPSTEGSLVRVTENGEVYNPFFRFVSKFIIGHEHTAKNYLDSLSARMANVPETQAAAR